MDKSETRIGRSHMTENIFSPCATVQPESTEFISGHLRLLEWTQSFEEIYTYLKVQIMNGDDE